MWLKPVRKLGGPFRKAVVPIWEDSHFDEGVETLVTHLGGDQTNSKWKVILRDLPKKKYSSA